MLYLIEYDRNQGQVVNLRPFENADRRLAEEVRLILELRLNRAGIDREVVLLEASDEASLRRTHRRYFEDLAGLASHSPK